MKIVTKLDFNGYSKLMISLFYKKPAVWGMTAFGALIMILGILGGLAAKPLSSSQVWMFLLYGFIIILFPLIVIKFKTKRSFSSNKMLQEEIVYEFIDDKIIMTGTSFKSEMKWSKIHKVRKVKDWFLIYQSKNLMNLIHKKSIANNIGELEEIIKSQEGLKHNL